MFYDAQLRFLCDALENCKIKTTFLNAGQLHTYSGEEYYHVRPVCEFNEKINPNTIYKLKSELSCTFLFFILPETNNALMVIGPYITNKLQREQVLEWAESMDINPKKISEIETYYSSITQLSENNVLYAVVDSFAELIWGGSDRFTLVDIEYESKNNDGLNFNTNYHENTMMNIQLVESRYAYENELLRAVSKGQSQKAELIASMLSELSFETRLSDPLRNMKNYCIIMNTLLRKSAESAGVHPIYLDSLSSEFARKIEQLNSVSVVKDFMLDMFRSYCRLVRKRVYKSYSPTVQKAIMYIDADLTSDLSLSALSSALNISSGYLSALFKKETGETITAYVCNQRIEHAKLLLKTTALQIQTVAQHCGILDVHYFTKLFKRNTGVTPKEYRRGIK